MSRSKKVDSISCDGDYVEPSFGPIPIVSGRRSPSSTKSNTIDCDDVEYRMNFEKEAGFEEGNLASMSALSPPPIIGEYAPKPIENKPLEVGPVPATPSSNARLAQSVMDKIVASGIQQNIMLKETKRMPPEPQHNYPPPKQSGSDLSYSTPNIWPEKTASDKTIFSDPEANPHKLYVALVDLWSDEWLDWEPETIIETADADGVILDQVNLGKIFAIRSLLKTDEFFREPRVFEKICIAFADKIVDFGVLQIPKLYEIAGAVALIEKLFRAGEYSDEVAIYTAMVAVDEGFLLLPPELNFAGAHFNIELISRLGEETITLQDNIISAMGKSDITESEAIQYKRLMVCSYYIKNMLQGAK